MNFRIKSSLVYKNYFKVFAKFEFAMVLRLTSNSMKLRLVVIYNPRTLQAEAGGLC